jgi:hypothetical protein
MVFFSFSVHPDASGMVSLKASSMPLSRLGRGLWHISYELSGLGSLDAELKVGF